jgi:penicillin-binding protein 1A
VIAADGILHRAQYVAKIVTPLGKVLFANSTNGKRVLASQVARTETQMLTGVLENGTARGLSIGRPAAGKTGTTDKNVDAWFIGYTPQLTTAVWMGDPLGEHSMSNVGGISVFGATYPADIWKAYMEAAHAKLPVVDFIAPVESLWPSPQRIDEFGRHQSSYSSRQYVPTQTTIATVVPITTPTTTPPPIVAPTTSPPPTTKPGKPPKKGP